MSEQHATITIDKECFPEGWLDSVEFVLPTGESEVYRRELQPNSALHVYIWVHSEMDRAAKSGDL